METQIEAEKYMFGRNFMKIMSVTYLHYVPTNLKKNHNIKENNLKREEHRRSRNTNFESYIRL